MATVSNGKDVNGHPEPALPAGVPDQVKRRKKALAIEPAEALKLPEVTPPAPLPAPPEPVPIRRPRRPRTVHPKTPPVDGFRGLLGQAVGLRLDDVTRVFRMGEVKVAALQGVSLDIGPGEFVAVLGASGGRGATLPGLPGGPGTPTPGPA